MNLTKERCALEAKVNSLCKNHCSQYCKNNFEKEYLFSLFCWSFQFDFGELEPYAGKLASTVLRGQRRGNSPELLDKKKEKKELSVPTAQMAHLVFADTHPNAEKPKEPFFCQRSDRKN